MYTLQYFLCYTLMLQNYSTDYSTDKYFITAIENYFPVFAQPDINTRGVGRILDGYANP